MKTIETFSHGSGGQKSEVKLLAGLVISGGSVSHFFSQLLVAPEILGVSEALHIQLKYNSLNAISVYL